MMNRGSREASVTEGVLELLAGVLFSPITEPSRGTPSLLHVFARPTSEMPYFLASVHIGCAQTSSQNVAIVVAKELKGRTRRRYGLPSFR
jgi:hypothetical protein